LVGKCLYINFHHLDVVAFALVIKNLVGGDKGINDRGGYFQGEIVVLAAGGGNGFAICGNNQVGLIIKTLLAN